MGGLKTIGVIGLGSIGMRHAKNLKAMGFRVNGYDPILERRLMLNGVLYNRDELIQPHYTGLVIATPSNQHCVEIIETPLWMPLLIEKPIGVNEGDLAVLKEHIPQRQAPVMVGNNLRFHSCVKKAKEWLPKIGQPIWANFTCAQHNTKYTDHVLLNWGAHEIDLATYLLGPAQVATCIGTKDIVDLNLLHGNGCRTAIHLDYLSRPELRQHRIVGTEASIEIELAHGRTAVLIPRGDKVTISESFTGADSWDSNYIQEMRAFLDRIDGKETLGATGQDGLNVLELILEAIRLAS